MYTLRQNVCMMLKWCIKERMKINKLVKQMEKLQNNSREEENRNQDQG